MRKTLSVLSVLLLLAAASFGLISGCPKQQASIDTQRSTSEPTTTAGAVTKAITTTQLAATTTSTANKSLPKPNKTALYDGAHREIFTPTNPKLLGLSITKDILEQRAYAVKINNQPFTAAALKRVQTVIIAGPMTAFTEHEITALHSFVSQGGNIIITLHLADVAAPLVQRFGFQISTSVVAQSHDTIEGKPKWFTTQNVTDDPLTIGVSGLAVQAAWGLQSSSDAARTVISSADDSWIDYIPNDTYDQREPVAAFGLAGVASTGKGKVAVFGDDAVFTNRTIEMAGNKRLFENILTWFEQS